MLLCAAWMKLQLTNPLTWGLNRFIRGLKKQHTPIRIVQGCTDLRGQRLYVTPSLGCLATHRRGDRGDKCHDTVLRISVVTTDTTKTQPHFYPTRIHRGSALHDKASYTNPPFCTIGSIEFGRPCDGKRTTVGFTNSIFRIYSKQDWHNPFYITKIFFPPISTPPKSNHWGFFSPSIV